ncbi:MAG: alpha/beta hydrolase [Patulibacter sp.]
MAAIVSGMVMLVSGLIAAVMPAAGAGSALVQRASSAAGMSTAVRAAAALDPDDIAMTFSDSSPCVSPCLRQGLTYERVSSALNPDGGTQPYALDLYRSARTPKRRAAVVVLLHGGGFVSGDRTQLRSVASALARAGFLVASIDYRLVPEARNHGAGIVSDLDLIPAAEEAAADAVRAMQWIRAHRRTLGATADRQRYAVGGYSAGALTALRVAVRGGDRSTPSSRRWRVGAGFAFSGTECGSWTKAYDCTAAYDRSDAPILLFHGETDTIVPAAWARQTCEAAHARGGGCTGYFYPGQDHFWPNGTIFGGGSGLGSAHPAVVPALVAFLRRQLAEG